MNDKSNACCSRLESFESSSLSFHSWMWHKARMFSFSRCSNISDQSLIYLINRVSGIDHLDLRECKFDSNRVLQHITNKTWANGLRSLSLAHWIGFTDDQLKYVTLCKQLICLDLEGTSVTSHGIRVNLSGLLPELQILNLGENDEIFEPPECKHLRSLSLSNTRVSRFPSGPLLEELKMQRTPFPDANEKYVGTIRTFLYPRLKLVDLSWTNTTDEFISLLPGIAPNFESLILIHCSKITDKALSFLCRLNKLRLLNLQRTMITDRGIRYLGDGNGLERLDLRAVYGITLNGLQGLSLKVRVVC